MINIQMWNKSPSQLTITQFLIVDFQTVTRPVFVKVPECKSESFSKNGCSVTVTLQQLRVERCV